MTRDEQIQSLHIMASRGDMRWLFWICLYAAIACLYLGVKTAQPPYYFGALFLGAVSLSAKQTNPHILRAAEAAYGDKRSKANVHIKTEAWSDSVDYYAFVQTETGVVWKMEFIPANWKPLAGELVGEAYFVPGVEWPALLIVAEGLIYPRRKPEKLRNMQLPNSQFDTDSQGRRSP